MKVIFAKVHLCILSFLRTRYLHLGFLFFALFAALPSQAAPTLNFLVNGGIYATASTSDTVTYTWSSSGAVRLSSSWWSTDGSGSCGVTNGTWSVNTDTGSPFSGSISAQPGACQIGHQYGIELVAHAADGSYTNAYVYVTVTGSGSNPIVINFVINNQSNVTNVTPGSVMTLSWSATPTNQIAEMYSVFLISNGDLISDSCGNRSSGNWILSGNSGTHQITVQPCQAGYRYRFILYYRNVNGVNNWVQQGVEYTVAGVPGVPMSVIGGTPSVTLGTPGPAMQIFNPSATENVNIALASGVTASASSTYAGFNVSAIIDGEFSGSQWGTGGGWNAGNGGNNEWVQINFPSNRTVAEVDITSIQDNFADPVMPSFNELGSLYMNTAYIVSVWNGSSWAQVGSISNTNRIRNVISFSPVFTSAVRVYITGTSNGFARIAEVEVYSRPMNVPIAVSTNWAAASQGATAVASSTYSAGFPASSVLTGNRAGVNWANGGGWNDGTSGSFPDTLEINLNNTRIVSQVDIYTVQDNFNSPSTPTSTMKFTQYGITAFQVQVWSGDAWINVETVKNNSFVWRKLYIKPVLTNKVRVVVNNGLNSFSRITAVEVY